MNEAQLVEGSSFVLVYFKSYALLSFKIRISFWNNLFNFVTDLTQTFKIYLKFYYD